MVIQLPEHIQSPVCLQAVKSCTLAQQPCSVHSCQPRPALRLYCYSNTISTLCICKIEAKGIIKGMFNSKPFRTTQGHAVCLSPLALAPSYRWHIKQSTEYQNIPREQYYPQGKANTIQHFIIHLSSLLHLGSRANFPERRMDPSVKLSTVPSIGIFQPWSGLEAGTDGKGFKRLAPAPFHTALFALHRSIRKRLLTFFWGRCKLKNEEEQPT